MKLNISYPAAGCQKLFEIVHDHKVRIFFDKRIGAEVLADPLGDDWAGYVLKITGGNDRQGFPMKQGVLTTGRVRLLMGPGHSCYRQRRDGERRRKSVRGCVVDANLSVLSLVIVRKGEKDIPGLTDTSMPRRLGPKRANKIRRLFNLKKKDDVRRYVVKRPLRRDSHKPVEEEEVGEDDRNARKKQRFKAPKIQRLITPQRLQRKRHRLALKKRRCLDKKERENLYKKILAQRHKETRMKREEMRRHRTTSSMSKGSKDSKNSDVDLD